MGGSSWSSDAYSSLKQKYSNTTKDDAFSSSKLDTKMSPKGVKFREARDSAAHPESLAINVFLDETGSMGEIPYELATKKLGALIETLIKHGIEHPAVLFGGIGDQYSDSSPLQVGQFESGTKELDMWLTKIYLEGNGGGQRMESYQLAWLFASRHTSIDCFEKRGEKGFLFTIGDEACHRKLEEDGFERIMGYKHAGMTREQLLKEAEKMYHVFHIHINHGGNYSDIVDDWKKLLGERCIVLDDYKAVAEVIASTVGIMHGIELEKITKSFNKQIASTVTKSLSAISATPSKKKSGVTKL